MPRKHKKPAAFKKPTRSRLPGYLLMVDAAVRRGQRFFSVAVPNAPALDDVHVEFRDEHSQSVDEMLELCYRMRMQTRIIDSTSRGKPISGSKLRKLSDRVRKEMCDIVREFIELYPDEFSQLIRLFDLTLWRCSQSLRRSIDRHDEMIGNYEETASWDNSIDDAVHSEPHDFYQHSDDDIDMDDEGHDDDPAGPASS